MRASSLRPMREAAERSKPRGRVMVYRDWLCDLAPAVSSYVRALCHKRRADMKEQLLALYDLAQESCSADFVAALELAAEQQMYSAEYVRAILALPTSLTPDEAAEVRVSQLLSCVPTQQEVERDLAEVMSAMWPIAIVCWIQCSWAEERRYDRDA